MKVAMGVFTSRGDGRLIIVGLILIYSCSASLIYFEIDCFYSL